VIGFVILLVLAFLLFVVLEVPGLVRRKAWRETGSLFVLPGAGICPYP
jgi:hypothetical protein